MISNGNQHSMDPLPETALTEAARQSLVREGLLKAAFTPGIRTEKVVPAKVSIAEGGFETQERIEGTVSRILKAHFA